VFLWVDTLIVNVIRNCRMRKFLKFSEKTLIILIVRLLILIGSSRVVEFYCNYPSIKILVKSDLLILYDTVWAGKQTADGNIISMNCNALCAVYCNLNFNNIECTSKFSGQISAVIRKWFTHSHHKMSVYSNKIPVTVTFISFRR